MGLHAGEDDALGHDADDHDGGLIGDNMAKTIPIFTYSGSCSTAANNDYWYIYLKTTGTLTFEKDQLVDVFLVGGGGGCYKGYKGGAGGGYTRTVKGISAKGSRGYPIVIGAGGIPDGAPGSNSTTINGQESSAFGYKAAGGKAGTEKGGNGGSGGGAGASPLSYTNMSGGTDGNNGASNPGDGSAYTPGKGQRNTPGPNGETGSTREFGEPTGKLYASGGVGCSTSFKNGAANTGNGGDGAQYSATAGAGGSGIVVIRGKGELPVTCNGTKLEKIIFNGVEVKSLIVNGVKLFMERMKRRMQAWNTSTRAGSASSRPI